LLVLPGSLLAKEKSPSAQQETRITANKVVYSRNDSTVRFEGNVHASRDAFEIWCAEMTVYVNKEGAAAEGNQEGPSLQSERNFERIVAEGDVRLQMEGRSAESRKAIYESGPEVLTLIGDVLLKEQRNTIEGQKVKLYLKEDRSEVMSGEEGQVEAVFYSSEEDESQ
jgi:lipopolysaccharide export system protein LptA